MIDVNTKEDLKHALHSDEDIIHVSDRNRLGIIKRPYKYRRILFAYHSKGYRLIKLTSCGSFDVKLVRKDTIK